MTGEIICLSADLEAARTMGGTLESLGPVRRFTSLELCAEWLEQGHPAALVMRTDLSVADSGEFLEQLVKVWPACRSVLVVHSPDVSGWSTLVNRGYVHGMVIEPCSPVELVQAVGCQTAIREAAVSGTELQRRLLELEAERDRLSRHLEAATGEGARQIERAKREWERTADAISSPLILVDRQFGLVRANLAAARYRGQDIRSLPGRQCHDVLFDRDSPCPGCPLVGGDASAWDERHDTDLDDVARERTFRLSVYAVRFRGAELRFACYYNDITDALRLQGQIRQADKMAAIGQLSGGVAHELNNPVGVIRSFAQLSKYIADELDNEELSDNLREIEGAAVRCQKIISSLLEFSRPTRAEERDVLPLNETVEKALFLVGTHKGFKLLQVVKEFDPDLPLVIGNSNQLLQVFVNLIQNAVQAMDENGVLRLASDVKDGQWVHIVVEDSGPGIPEEHLTRIFEPFFTTKDPGNGTGLGLSITYNIVESHGGRIEVDSELEKGTRFHVYLPAEMDM